MKKLRRLIGSIIRKFGERIMPKYWICVDCGAFEGKEWREHCHRCGSEMIYMGLLEPYD